MASRRVLWGVGAFAAYLALGFAVARGAPSPFDLVAQSERGRFPAVALALTRVGLFPAYVTICVAGLAFGVVRRTYLPAAAILACEMLVAWFASDAFKALFRRARPDYYYSIHETSYAYSSGHATLALACYGFIAYVAWQTSAPTRIKRLAIVAAGLLALAIGWSRLALGAHYPTDLVGGYLLGTVVLLGATALYDRVRARRAALTASVDLSAR